MATIILSHQSPLVIFSFQRERWLWCNAAAISVEVPGFHLSCTNPERAFLDDEDWFCSEACEQDGSYKSIVTATKVKGGQLVQCTCRQLQMIWGVPCWVSETAEKVAIRQSVMQVSLQLKYWLQFYMLGLIADKIEKQEMCKKWYYHCKLCVYDRTIMLRHFLLM